MATFAAIENPDNSDLTVTIEPDTIETVTNDLANETDNDAIILPNDLENSIDTVEIVLRYIL